MRMVVVGDSVLWGQGLSPHEKIGRLTRKRLVEAGWQVDFDEENDFFAHSGAIIGAQGDTGDEADPQIDPVIRGEIPTDHPTVYTQLTRIQNPAGVDLLCMDGGANDFGIMGLAKPRLNFAELEQDIRTSLNNAHGAIAAARSRCPNATILYSGYYCAASEDTSFRAMEAIAALGSMLLSGALASPAAHLVKDRIKLGNHFWQHVQVMVLRSAVAQAVTNPDLRGPGLGFVHPRFGVHNALAATNGEPRVWSVVTSSFPDSVYQERRAACAVQHDPSQAVRDRLEELTEDLDELQSGDANWTDDLMDDLIGEATGTAQDLLTCENAAAFHPNPDGAEAYAEAFADTFERISRVSLHEFTTKLAPETRSVRTAIKRWGLDGPRAPSLNRPSSLSLRELSQHRTVDYLMVTIETAGLRQGTTPLPASNWFTERFAAVHFGTGGRRFEFASGGQRHLPSSGGLLAHNEARFLVDPSFSVHNRRGEGTPLHLEDIQTFRVYAPDMAAAPPTVNWPLLGIQVLLNGSVVIYDTTGDPAVGVNMDRDTQNWFAGEGGAPEYPAPE